METEFELELLRGRNALGAPADSGSQQWRVKNNQGEEKQAQCGEQPADPSSPARRFTGCYIIAHLCPKLCVPQLFASSGLCALSFWTTVLERLASPFVTF